MGVFTLLFIDVARTRYRQRVTIFHRVRGQLLITAGGDADVEDPGGSDAGGKLISIISLALLPKMSPVVLDSGSFLATAALLPSEIFSPRDSAMLCRGLAIFYFTIFRRFLSFRWTIAINRRLASLVSLLLGFMFSGTVFRSRFQDAFLVFSSRIQ